MSKTVQIRVGVGGWTFEPWRGVFYPDTVKQKDELSYMASQLRTIEVNGTYYSSFKPDSWRKWRDATPDGFVFTVKGSRFTSNRKVLAEAGESIDKFMGQGLSELGDKLGPIFWQFAPTKTFNPDDFGAFLALLPKSVDGVKVRHAVEVRHDSFSCPEFPALLRKHGIGNVYADHNSYPEIADVTADFVYARLQTGSDDCETAYEQEALKTWAARLKTWSAGDDPKGLPILDPSHKADGKAKDVFAYIIHEGKVRAPHGAQALQGLVDR